MSLRDNFKMRPKAATALAFLIGGRWREATDDGTRMRELLPAGSTETQMIRTAWIETEEEWYFSIQDVVAALTDSVDPKQYIKRMKSRDSQLACNRGTICTLVKNANKYIPFRV